MLYPDHETRRLLAAEHREALRRAAERPPRDDPAPSETRPARRLTIPVLGSPPQLARRLRVPRGPAPSA